MAYLVWECSQLVATISVHTIGSPCCHTSYSYPIGRTFQGNTRLYDAFNLLHSSQSTDHAISFNGVHGNPPVEFDLSISAEPNVLLELSNSNARSIDAEYFQGDSIRVQELILTTDLSSADCASLEEPGNPVNPVFALFGGNYFIHDPRFVSAWSFPFPLPVVKDLSDAALCSLYAVPSFCRKQSTILSNHQLPMEAEKRKE